MEREKLNQIIKALNNLYIKDCDREEINKVCELVGIFPFTEESLRQLEESNHLDEIIQKVISSVEENLKLEDEDFFYHELQQRYIPYIGNNKKKLELLNTKITNSFYRAEVIKSLSDDNTKIELLETIPENYKIEVVKSLKEDENKVVLLNTLKEFEDRPYTKLEVIVTLREDDKKLELLNILPEKPEYRTEVIASLDDEKKKIELLNTLPDGPYYKVEVIKSLKNDDKKIELLELLPDSEKTEVIITLKNDNKKVERLDELTEEDRRKVINSFDKDFMRESFSNEVLMKKYGAILQEYKYLFDKIENMQKVEQKKYKSFDLPETMTIGVEIEAEGKYTNSLINTFKKVQKWKLRKETSYNQIEAISPVIRDTEKDIDEIYKITNWMKELEFSVDEECAAHVHIGADYLEDVEEWQELLEIWGNTEEIFYLISNPPGQLPREGITSYAMPVSKTLEQSDLDKGSKDEFLTDARKIQKDRNTSINLINTDNGNNTIEFRLSNGTLDPDIWIENIRLYGRVVQMAHEISQINRKKQRGEEITAEQEQKLQMKATLKKEVSMDEKMGALMKLLFKEEEREVSEDRYIVNKDAEQQEKRMEKMKFGKVDFGNIYESTEIPENLERKLGNIERTDNRYQMPEIG